MLEDSPPDPSELEQLDILEKVTKNYFIFLIATVHLISVTKCWILTVVLILKRFISTFIPFYYYLYVRNHTYVIPIIFHQERDSNGSSSDEIIKKMQGLALCSPDPSYLVTSSSEMASEASSVGKTDGVEDQKLNDFLMSCNVKPVGNKSWLELVKCQ